MTGVEENTPPTGVNSTKDAEQSNENDGNCVYSFQYVYLILQIFLFYFESCKQGPDATNVNLVFVKISFDCTSAGQPFQRIDVHNSDSGESTAHINGSCDPQWSCGENMGKKAW